MASPDIQLLFGVLGGGSLSGESGSQIKSELSQIVSGLNQNPLKVRIGLETKETQKLWSEQLRSKLKSLNDNGNFTVKVSKIDCSAAIADFKRQLSAVVNSVSLESGMSITLDSKDIGNIASSTKGVENAAKGAKKEFSELNAIIKEINLTNNKIGSAYASASAKLVNPEDVSQAEELRSKYLELEQATDALRAKRGSASQEDIDNIYRLQTEMRDLISVTKERKTASEAAAKSEKDTNKEQMATVQEVISAYERLNKYLTMNPRAAETSQGKQLAYIRDQMKGAIDAVGSLGDNVSTMDKGTFRKMSADAKELQLNLKSTGKEGKTLADIISGAYEKFGGWMLITRSMMAAIQSVKQMVASVREIDTAMTELKKVTSETDAVYTQFLTNAATRATQLGSSISDVVTASADFARLGYGIEDASMLADAAIMYKNVGDGIENISVASESIISTMKAFGIEASDAMLIVDKFNETGNNFAISSKGVGDALVRSAAALAAAGNDFDESIALITAANNVVQDPDKVGNALKTVSMYLRAAKTEAEEAGESTDGMAVSVSKLRDEILALTNGKVDIQLDENTFKSTTQILRELSEVWNELTDITQANILEKIGGKRNSNVVVSLLENFDTVEDVLASSANAAGSALAENEKYLESIEGKISQFRAAFEKLSTLTINSDSVKNIVDLGTGAMNVLSGIIEKFGGVATASGLVAAALSTQNIGWVKVTKTTDTAGKTITGLTTIFGQTGNIIKNDKRLLDEYNSKVDALAEGFSDTKGKTAIWNDTIAKGSLALKNSIKVTDTVKVSSEQYGAALTQTTAKTVAMNIASKAAAVGLRLVATAANMLLSMAISAAISLVVNALSDLINKSKEAREAARESAEEYKSNIATLDEYRQKITELKQSLKDGNLSEEEAYNVRKELLSIQDEIVAAYGEEAGAIDLVRMSTEEASNAIDGISKSFANSNLTQNASAIKEAVSKMEEVKSYRLNLGLSNDDRFSGEIERIISKYQNASILKYGPKGYQGEAPWIDIVVEADARQAEETIVGLAADFRELGKEWNDTLGTDISFSAEFENQLSEIESIIDEYGEIYDQQMIWKIAVEPDYSSIMNSIKDAKSQLTDAIASGDDEAAKAAYGLISAIRDNIASQDFSNDPGIESYLTNLLNEIEDISPELKIKVDLETDLKSDSTLKDRINNLLKPLLEDDGTLDVHKVLNVGIDYEHGADLPFGPQPSPLQRVYTDDQQAYRGLIDMASQYGVSVEQLVGALEELGIVQTTTLEEGTSEAIEFSSVFSEELSKSVDGVQTNIKTLGDALAKLGDGTLEATDVIDLIQQFPELAEYVDLTAEGFGNLDDGLRKVIADSPTELIETLQGLKETNNLTEKAANQIDVLCDALESMPDAAIKDISGEFGLVAEAINNANKALTDLDKALAGDDYDAGYDARVKHLETFKETIENGEYGSKAYSAYKDYYGLVGLSSDEVRDWVAQNEKYLTEGQEGIARFLDTVAELGSSGGALDGIASYEDGVFSYDITRLGEFADALGWSEEMLQDFINKYRMYSEDFLTRTAEDNLAEFTQTGLIFDVDESSFASMSKLQEYTHLSKEEVTALIDEINKLKSDNGEDGIKLIDDSALRSWEGWNDGEFFSGDQLAALRDAAQLLGLTMDDMRELRNSSDAFDDIMSPLLEGIGWTSEEIDNLRAKIYGKPWAIKAIVEGVESDNLSDLLDNLESLEIPIDVNADGALVVTQDLIDRLSDAGASAQEIEGIITGLANRDDVIIKAGLEIDGESVDEAIKKKTSRSNSDVEVSVKMNVDDEDVIATVTTTVEEVEKILGDGWETTLDCDSEQAEGNISTVQKLLKGLPKNTTVSVHGRTSAVTSELQSVLSYLQRIENNKNKTVTITYKTVGSPSSRRVAQNATGTPHAKAGMSLLGDEYSPSGKPKPELVVSGDYAYLAGKDGPTLGYLNEGDIVYSYQDTKRILGNAIPAFAGGTNSLGSGYSPYIPGAGTTNNGSSSSQSNSGKSSLKVTATLDNTDLEEKLKDTLDKLKKEIDDIIGNFEHSIFIMEKKGAKSSDIIAVYRKMQEAVHTQAEKYRALGLKDNSDYIQALQKQWWEYQDSIQEVIIADYEKSVSERENAITLTENWLENAVGEHNPGKVEKYANDIVAYYKTMQDTIHQQAEYYRSKGYADTSDEVSKLSDLWWEYAKSINEVKQRVVDNLIDMVTEASAAVDEIQSVFDALQSAADEYAKNGGFISVDSFQKLVELGPEYMQYLRDENGLLVINAENINKVIAAKTQQLAVQSAMNYVERLRLAMESDSIEDLNQLLFATTDATNATWGLVYANLALLGLDKDQYQAALHNINAYRSLADSACESIGKVTNAAEDEQKKMKSGVDDILKYVMDMLKHRVQEQIDALEEMKDNYSDIIRLRKEALRAAKEEAEYQDNVADKVKKIAKLQERINALSLDDSREAQAEKIKLQEELAGVQKELGDTQGDHALETQENVLDEMEESYHAEKDREIQILEDSISSYQKLYDMAIQYIETHWDTLYQELISWNTQYGNVLNSEITTAWENALLAAQKYGSYVNALKNLPSDTSSSSNSTSGGSGNGNTPNTIVGKTDYDTTSTDEEQIHAIIARMYANGQAWGTASKQKKIELHQDNVDLAKLLKPLGITAVTDGATWFIDKIGGPLLFDVYKKYRHLQGNKYHSGGIVGNDPSLKQNEVLALLEKGEIVLNKQKEQGLYRIIDFASAVSERLKDAMSNSISSNMLGLVQNDISDLRSKLPNNIVNNQNEAVHFGDVYIYGANEQTVEKHREINRQFANEVLSQLRISKR